MTIGFRTTPGTTIMKRLLATFLLLTTTSAHADDPSAATGLAISPRSTTLRGARDRVQLIVDRRRGTEVDDATHEGSFSSCDPTIARVLSSGVVRPAGDGSTQVVFEWGTQRQMVDVTITGMAESPAVSFSSEVVPALTKAGCNAGKCHGAPNGKGGFALSLRGFDMAADLGSLTRQHGARRINRIAPRSSLMLLKATASVAHGGGRRFGISHPLYGLLREWITGPVSTDIESSPPVELTVYPVDRWLPADAQSQQLRVMARWEDGRRCDVTHLARLSLSDSRVAEISADGLLTRAAGGEVTVAAQYGTLQTTSHIVMLARRENFAYSDPPENNFIDRAVFDKLRRLRINPAPLAADATFIRRAYLDLCGLIPTADEVRRFLADTRAGKREILIDSLLDRPEYADFWAMKWADRLGCNQRFVGKIGARKFYRWIRHHVAVNTPEDEFTRSVITASGGNYGNPPAGFYRLSRTAEARAEHVSQVFLGVRIGCARCHNHPGERWTQNDYYGLAAFFTRIKYRDGPFFIQKYDKEETVVPTRSGEIKHARTGAIVAPKLLGAVPQESAEDDADDRRERLARWMTDPDNPFFARAAVNRIWFHLFGRGIVEPVDDFRGSNPPSHPDLLDALAGELVSSGFDRKHVTRTIMRSRVYQLASSGDETQDADNRYFARAGVRLMGAEQLLDSIGRATGSPQRFKGFPASLRSSQLPDGEIKHRFLTTFGRPARSLACACEREDDSNLGQALELVGGSLIETKIQDADGRLTALLNSSVSDTELIEELFLSTLSRFPAPDEQDRIASRLASAEDRRAAAEDILWALVNHREFLFQH